MQELFSTLFQVVITAAVPVVAVYVIKFLNERAAHVKESTKSEIAERLISEVEDSVTTAVAYISQTYVDELKKNGTFSSENQQKALNSAASFALTMLTKEAVNFINEAYGSPSDYLVKKIEAEVKRQK